VETHAGWRGGLHFQGDGRQLKREHRMRAEAGGGEAGPPRDGAGDQSSGAAWASGLTTPTKGKLRWSSSISRP
jgi:hypothetical protein